jgi:hypothetical protein
MIINPPKSHGKGAGLSHVTSTSEMLVHFGEENGTKLDESMAFTKLGDELIAKGGVMSRFPDTSPDARCLLDARDAAALLGKRAWNALEIFRRLAPLGLVYCGVHILPRSLLYSSFPFLSFESSS